MGYGFNNLFWFCRLGCFCYFAVKEKNRVLTVKRIPTSSGVIIQEVNPKNEKERMIGQTQVKIFWLKM